VSDLGEVVGQVAVAELHTTQVPPVIVGRVEALAFEGGAPAGEYAGADRAGDDLGRDLLAEAQQSVDVDVPSVLPVGDLDDPRPAQ
jgi:hypothetical protein